MFEYMFMQNAFIVAVLIALVCPLIGIFLVLRRYSMIGDALAHASLAGVAVGLLVHANPVMSAFAVTSFFGLLIEMLRNKFKRYAELILVIILSFSVGIAITIISSGAVRANVESFLFGSMLTVTNDDVISVIILSAVTVATVVFLFPQLVMLTFDEDAAKIAGVKSQMINYIFSVLVAATISVSIRVVGILVISSLIALPVATSLQLHRGFRSTMLYAVFFSLFDVIAGLILSFEAGTAPGGLTAVISVIVLLAVIAVMQMRRIIDGRRREVR